MTHRDDRDWSLNASAAVPAKAGDIFDVKAWIKIDGVGRAIPTAAAVAADGRTVDWSLGGEELAGPKDWVLSSSRLVVPAGVVRLTPRVIGTGPATVWFDDYQLLKVGNLDEMRSKNLPGRIGISNAFLRVTLNTVYCTRLRRA